MSTSIRRALILAAGRGQRLMPLTADRPKPMVMIANRPILERILLGLMGAGIEEAVIVHGYLGSTIINHFGDGAAVGMRLRYCEQAALTGTAGAMLLAEEFCGDAPFLLHWGDILLAPANYPAILKTYTNAAPACVMGINWLEDPYTGGAVYRDGMRVTGVKEKLPRGTAGTHWNNGGLIAFSSVIWDYLRQTQRQENGEYFLTDALDLMAQRGELVLVHEMIGERVHISTPEDVAPLHTDPRIAAWEAAYRVPA